jgi:hypothetical protein
MAALLLLAHAEAHFVELARGQLHQVARALGVGRVDLREHAELHEAFLRVRHRVVEGLQVALVAGENVASLRRFGVADRIADGRDVRDRLARPVGLVSDLAHAPGGDFRHPEHHHRHHGRHHQRQ